MKVLYIHSGYPNFSEAFIQNEMDHLKAQAVEVQVLNLNWCGNQSSSIPIQCNTLNPLNFRWGISLLKSKDIKAERNSRSVLKRLYLKLSSSYLLRQVRTFEPDVILSHFTFSTSMVASRIASHLGMKHHLRLHTTYSTLSSKSLKELLISSSSISGISKDVICFYQTYVQFQGELIRQDIKLESLDYQFRAPGVKVKLLAAGRFVAKKGFENLIQALSLLPKDELIGIQLELVGDGPLKAHYERLIKNHSLKDVVTLTPAMSHLNLIRLLSEKDLLIIPSIDHLKDQEGIPTVAIEAMAKGVTVLCSKVGAIKEIIDDGEQAYLMKDTSPFGISESLRDTLKKKVEWEYVCQQARKRIDIEYNRRLNPEDLNIE